MNKGVIRISEELYNDYEIIGLMFQYFKPLKIDREYWSYNDFIIYGESKLFEIVHEGCVIPEYEVVVNKLENETYSFKFNKK